jgi:hypothetical protein
MCSVAAAQRSKARIFALLAAWCVAAVAICPVVFHWTAPPASARATHLAIDLGYLAAVVLCWAMYHAESVALGRTRAAVVVFLALLLSTITNKIHNFNVDHASNYIAGVPNEALQEQLHASVTRLSPTDVPHSYRFLPNAIVLWMQLAGVRFDAARDLYRLLTMLVLFYAIYRFARLYTHFLGGAIAMLLVCVVYPISFENYIGQLTDPLSHLSFALAFLFLAAGDFASLVTVLLIGSLAKETVLALAGFYVIFCRKEANYVIKSIALCAASFAMYIGVRLLVLHGVLHYRQVSGTMPNHIVENWLDIKWHRLFLLTAGAYVPFLALAWRETPLLLKQLTFYLIPVLFVSSLLFGWLSESRNFMPVVFVLAVVAARFLAAQCEPSQ